MKNRSLLALLFLSAVLVGCSAESSPEPRVEPPAAPASAPAASVLASPGGGGSARAPLSLPNGTAQLTGRVELPDGTPVGGAVVVTTLGGQAVTGPRGRFALDVEGVGPSTVVGVTTLADVGDVSHSATVQVAGPTVGGTTDVGVLVLQPVACDASWLPAFGEQPGATSRVRGLAVLDLGTGPELYAAGDFERIGGASSRGVGRWDGTGWSSLGSGLGSTGDRVHAIAAFDDGSGEVQLFAGGRFLYFKNSQFFKNIVRWDAVAGDWTPFGSNAIDGTVEALAQFDDGSGPALYVAGDFVGGIPGVGFDNLARWNGQQWSSIGSLLGNAGVVRALCVHDDGSGPALYVGGSFTTAGGVPVSSIARWDGTSWSSVNAGHGSVNALVEHDDGSGGVALFAAGSVKATGAPTSANGVARWDGSTWTMVGTAANGLVQALASAQVDGTSALVAGGEFTAIGGVAAGRVAIWDGAQWSPFAPASPGHSGFGQTVRALASYAAPGGSEVLFAGGDFAFFQGEPGDRIARWSESGWRPPSDGLDASVETTAVFDDGSGPALYAAGRFFTAGGQPARQVARWDGSAWTPIGAFDPPNPSIPTSSVVLALEVFDDGSGPALYAGGGLTTVDGVPVNGLVRWDGATWTQVALGVDGTVRSLLAVGASSSFGPALYVGGTFGFAGGLTAWNLARWDGAAWSGVGDGVGLPFGSDQVLALELFDDGSGEALWVGGSFGIAGGISGLPVRGLAKWNGSAWSNPGNVLLAGRYGAVHELAVLDDGGGPALFACGDFDSVGAVAAQSVARWDGASWTGLGGAPLEAGSLGRPLVYDLRVHDDGSGPALFACGSFGFTVEPPGSPGAPPALLPFNIARRTAEGWTPVGGGLSGAGRVLAAFRVPGSPRPSLFVGGDFATALDSGDSYLALWGCQ